MSNVSVPVTNDDIAKGTEEFNLMLTVPRSLAPAITAGGRDTAVGMITDSTSKCVLMVMVTLYQVFFIASVGSGICIRTVCWFRVIRIYRSYSENNRRIIQYSYYCNGNSFCTVTSISYG